MAAVNLGVAVQHFYFAFFLKVVAVQTKKLHENTAREEKDIHDIKGLVLPVVLGKNKLPSVLIILFKQSLDLNTYYFTKNFWL